LGTQNPKTPSKSKLIEFGKVKILITIINMKVVYPLIALGLATVEAKNLKTALKDYYREVTIEIDITDIFRGFNFD